MPDHIKFFNVMGMMSADWGRSNAMTEYVSSNTSLDESQAAVFVGKLRPLGDAMRVANRHALEEAACVPDLDDWSATRAMTALNRLEDVNEAVWQTYFEMAKIWLSENEVAALREMMSSFSATLVRSDFTQVYKANPERAKTKLAQLCGR